MASLFGAISRAKNEAVVSCIQRCSSSSCSNVKILSALSLTGAVKNAVPTSVGSMMVDMRWCILLFMRAGAINRPLRLCYFQFAAQDLAYNRLGQRFAKFDDLGDFVAR